MGDRITHVKIDFILVQCHDCGSPYLIMSNMDGRDHCPYCDHDKMYSLLYEERTKNNSVLNEIESLKRSNAALRGVITKLKRVNVEKVDAAPVEVYLSDLSNYVETYFNNYFGECSDHCDISARIGCENKGFPCETKIGYNAIFKLKPEIKAALDSGKAVAKGGK